MEAVSQEVCPQDTQGCREPPSPGIRGQDPFACPSPSFPSHARGLCDQMLFSSFPRGITAAAAYLLISGGSFHTPDHALLL